MRIRYTAIISAVVLHSLCSCATNAGDGEVQRILRDHGIVALSPAQGDIHNPRHWNQFGPGAVRSVKRNVSLGSSHAWSDEMTGGNEVVKKAMKKNEHVTLMFPQKISVHAERSGDFAAGSLVSEAAEVAAAASAARINRVEIEFHNVQKSSCISTVELENLLKANKIRIRWGWKVIHEPVFADSITYRFYSNMSNGQEVKVNIPGTAQTAIKGKGLQIQSGELKTTSPTFIGFYPLH